MQIHLQRIVGTFVGSAHGAGQFYSRAVTEPRDATAKASNDALDGPVGYDSAAQRKREFAADMEVQSHALRIAAEGGVANDKQAIFQAAAHAQRAVSFLHSLQPEAEVKAAA